MYLRPLSFVAVAALALLPLSHTASTQVSKAELKSISIPEKAESSIGTLGPWIKWAWRPGEIALVK